MLTLILVSMLSATALMEEVHHLQKHDGMLPEVFESVAASHTNNDNYDNFGRIEENVGNTHILTYSNRYKHLPEGLRNAGGKRVELENIHGNFDGVKDVTNSHISSFSNRYKHISEVPESVMSKTGYDDGHGIFEAVKDNVANAHRYNHLPEVPAIPVDAIKYDDNHGNFGEVRDNVGNIRILIISNRFKHMPVVPENLIGKRRYKDNHGKFDVVKNNAHITYFRPIYKHVPDVLTSLVSATRYDHNHGNFGEVKDDVDHTRIIPYSNNFRHVIPTNVYGKRENDDNYGSFSGLPVFHHQPNNRQLNEHFKLLSDLPVIKHAKGAQNAFPWVASEGKKVFISYLDDEHGLHSAGKHLREAAPKQPQIQKTLEWIASHAEPLA